MEQKNACKVRIHGDSYEKFCMKRVRLPRGFLTSRWHLPKRHGNMFFHSGGCSTLQYMDVSENGGTQQPWVFPLKMIILGCFGGTTIYGNTHMSCSFWSALNPFIAVFCLFQRITILDYTSSTVQMFSMSLWMEIWRA